MEPHKHVLEVYPGEYEGRYYCPHPNGCWDEFWTDEAVQYKLEDAYRRGFNDARSAKFVIRVAWWDLKQSVRRIYKNYIGVISSKYEPHG